MKGILNERRRMQELAGIMSEGEDWGDSDKIGRAADLERGGKKELYYVVDGKGDVKNISTTPMAADDFLDKNYSRLGGGRVMVAIVPLEDWQNEKVTPSTIKKYSK